MFFFAMYSFFNIWGLSDFERIALKIFNGQACENKVYKKYIELLGVDKNKIKSLEEIPFLPINFFKNHKVITGHQNSQKTFLSSGTTGPQSKHYVSDLAIYQKSCLRGFENVYGDIKNWTILALLPNYLETKDSSLVYMVNHLIEKSKNRESGFYLYDLEKLRQTLLQLEKQQKKILLIGVSFALLDLAEKYTMALKHTVIMETGGMKGKRKELIREDLHQKIKIGLGVEKVHSEYGMTELLSQSYAKEKGIFQCPNWMKIFIRDPKDPLSLLENKKIGGINVIDLANINSCAFIATEDLGKKIDHENFEVLGRFDDSDLRGCNLLL